MSSRILRTWRKKREKVEKQHSSFGGKQEDAWRRKILENNNVEGIKNVYV